ncbi:thioredoxin domain-containing protein [Nitratiruptor sp. YY09-18]|uniref:thioredoxin domain-containing protein n=1 Tax=Nitratiruptor sp. YY09-18 TaxID=2724901 RepID=UPI001914EAED|nr:thioredoxin domain-containing protein [Nitratiruptor sp. YY09-18]BCD67871.1 hypothetical protein NitYY0918_C0778 [Nitratiruptor sp. YY09-18]
MKRVLLFILLSIFVYGHTNALIDEESPYLRQHAHNPVDWLPWGEEAFEKAKKEHKPLFVSIGYSTCHWCHVMEKESFENEEIAKLLNLYYVPVKVDKEERPDLDKYYQLVFSVMHHRSGGWPLTIIMSEDGIPFFSGTYIPPEDGYGVKGLKTILPYYAKVYKKNREKLENRGRAVLRLVESYLYAQSPKVSLDKSLAKSALVELEKSFDRIYGGFGKRVKFPESAKLELLLDIYEITKNKKALTMVTKTLDNMADRGLYDQIEGAFFRYTTDRAWEIPHFEKMLYTNAELIRVYTRAYTLTKNPRYKEVVEQTIKEIDRRFGIVGLYKSASDADTLGEEGRYFLFDYNEALRYLTTHGIDPKKAKEALKNLAITPYGNFDGELSHAQKEGKVDEKIVRLLAKLRTKYPYPFIDEKIITAWNAMYIDAKMRSFIFDRRYLDEAVQSLEKLLKASLRNGKLYHQQLPNKAPTKEAMLEDYAFLIKALSSAYQLTFQKRYLDLANRLFVQAKQKFYKNGTWYYSAIVPADLNDSYYSSALGTLYHAMLDLAMLQEDFQLYNFAKASIEAKGALIKQMPASYPTATRAMLRVIVGDVLLKSANIDKYLEKIASIPYPYLLDKKEPIKDFMACKIDSCFASSESFDEIEEKIVKLLEEQQAKQTWGSKNAR